MSSTDPWPTKHRHKFKSSFVFTENEAMLDITLSLINSSSLLQNQRIIVQYFNPRLLEGVTIAEGTFEVENEWIHVESLTSFEAEQNNIFIITSEFNGDIIIDHASGGVSNYFLVCDL